MSWPEWSGLSATARGPELVARRRASRYLLIRRKRLFIATSRITADAAEYFGLPRDRTVVIGSHVEV
jgi:K+ transporter